MLSSYRTVTCNHYNGILNYPENSSSSVGATARYGLWPVEQYLFIFPYLSPTVSIFSLPALEDLFLLLSILSWVFLFVSSRPVLAWRSFWASCPPPFSPGDPANLTFAPLSILLYFPLYSSLRVLELSHTTVRCELWPVEQYLSILSYLSPTLSIFSLPALGDLFLLLLSTLSWVFLFVSSFPVLEWRYFLASYPPPFSPGYPTNLSFAPLSILLYFLFYSSLLVLEWPIITWQNYSNDRLVTIF